MGTEEKDQKGTDEKLIPRITKAVRIADERFQSLGGSSRHWVIECLIPELELEGLKIVEKEKP